MSTQLGLDLGEQASPTTITKITPATPPPLPPQRAPQVPALAGVRRPPFLVRSVRIEGVRWYQVTDLRVDPPTSVLCQTYFEALRQCDPAVAPVHQVEPTAGLPTPHGPWRVAAPGADMEVGDRDPGELIRAGEAAYLLGCTTKTVQHWAERGLLSCERPIPEHSRGRAYVREPDRRYRLGEVLNLAREKKRLTFVVDRRQTPRERPTATQATSETT